MKLKEFNTYFLDHTDQLVVLLNSDFTIQDFNATGVKQFSKIGIKKGVDIHQYFVNKKDNVLRNTKKANHNLKIVLIHKDRSLILTGKHLLVNHNKSKYHLLILKQRSDQIELIEEGYRIKGIDPLEKILQTVDIVFYRVKIDETGKKNLFFISSHVSDIFGLNYKEYLNAMRNGKILQYFHKEDYQKILETNKQVFEKRKASQVIYRFFNPKLKKYIWIEEKGYPVLDDKGKLIEMYGIARDINDRIESEIALSKTANLYKNIIENNLSGYYRMSISGVILEANKSFATILGHASKDKIIGKKIHKLYKNSTDGKDFIESLIKRKKAINHQSKVTLLSGEEKYFLENTSYVKNQFTGEEYIEGTLFDITENYNTQRALEQSEEKYKKLFEENLVGVFRTNVRGQIYDCNQSFLDIFGYKTKAEIQKRTSVDLYFSKADRDVYIRDLRKKGRLKNYTLRHKNKKGEEIWILANVELVKEGQEEVLYGTLIDITQSKLINDRLIQNIDKYRKLFEHASDAILMVKDWHIIDSNEIAARLLKMKREQLIGRKFSDFISYSDLTKAQKQEYDHIFVQKAKHKNRVSECVLKSGKTDKIHVEIAVSAIVEQGESIYQLIIHDNTKQVAEQRELEKSKQNFENLIEYSPDGNIIIYQDKVIYANTASVGILQLKNKKELLAKPISSFFATRQQPEILKLIHFVLENKTNTRFYEYQLKNKNQKGIEVGMQLTSMKYGDLDCVNMILYDLNLKKQLAQQELRANLAEEANKNLEKEISEHKITQNKLSDQIAKTHALLEGSQNVLIFTLDKNYNITSYNSIFEKTAAQIFNVDLKSNNNFIKGLETAITEEDRKIMFERFKLAFKGESVRLEGPMLLKRGGTVWMETFINPIKRNGKVVEISCFSTDITDKKLKNEELRASLKEKEVLLKEVHHRVKNNLQIISSILNLQTSFSNDQRVNEILKESQNRVKSMAYLHESLYQNKNFSYINFTDYLVNLSKNLVHSYYFSQGSVELKFDMQKVDLNLDQAIPCGLIVNELLTNAVKYAFNDTSKQGFIFITVKEVNGLVELSVADNGTGLPKGFNVDKTNTLGLQLVSTLTEQLDGELKVLNDNGARFSITFKKL